MITLTGVLRQAGEVRIKEQPRLKVVLEHEIPRESGPPDLHLETLFLPPESAQRLPKQGLPVSVEVRAYVPSNGRNVAFSALRLVDAPAAVAPPLPGSK
ncbi:MAG: hypothetical protein JO093_22200 [Acidobacteria bacterium]|nr:hypothetical protein [Acidobacteriota bacterium]